MDSKVVTIVVPHFMPKPGRTLLESNVGLALKFDAYLRWNGSGALHYGLEKPHDNILVYPPKGNYMGVTSDDFASEEERTQAIEGLMKLYPKAHKSDFLELLLASYYSLFGYGGTPSDFVLTYKGTHRSYRNDKSLFNAPLTMARKAGIPIKNL